MTRVEEIIFKNEIEKNILEYTWNMMNERGNPDIGFYSQKIVTLSKLYFGGAKGTEIKR